MKASPLNLQTSLTFKTAESKRISYFDNKDEFILVEHRRKRITKVPVLLIPKDGTCHLQKKNPLPLCSAIIAVANEKMPHHHFAACGGLRIGVAKQEAASRLLSIETFCEIEVQASVSMFYLQNYGLVKGAA